MNFAQILKSHQSGLLISIVGGCGEIGLNMTLYHLNGKNIMVDAGIGFSDQKILPGSDIMIPNIDFILENNIKIDALIITHGHEDHIGAIPYLYEDLGSPTIYATPLARHLIDSKLMSYDFPYTIKEIPLNNQDLNIEGFTIATYNLHHSIPEMRSLLIKTEFGNVLHSGDWNIEADPCIGKDDITELNEATQETPIDLMFCDSTNVNVSKKNINEKQLRKNLNSIVEQEKGLVVGTLFSSNVARIESFYFAAKASGRVLAVSGNALNRIIACAKKAGYLNEFDAIDAKEAMTMKRSDVLLLATGCQGEPLASLSKLCRDQHRFFKLKSGDAIIFSSRAIPSNLSKISEVEELALLKGVKIINSDNSEVHISGHAAREDLNAMYSHVKPAVVIPVHGDLFRLHEHQKLALNHPHVQDSIIAKDGNIIKLNKTAKLSNSVEIIGNFKTGYIGVDGKRALSPESDIVTFRKKMSYHGIAVCTLAISGSKKNLVCQPKLISYGSLDQKYEKSIIQDIESRLQELAQISIDRNKNQNIKKIKQEIHDSLFSAIKSYFKKNIGKMPVIEVQCNII